MNLNKGEHTAENKELENVAIGTFSETLIEDDFLVLTCQNETNENQILSKEIDQEFIQFHFCLKGLCKFNFNAGRYVLDIVEENSLLLYNPQRELPINIEVNSKTWVITVLIWYP